MTNGLAICDCGEGEPRLDEPAAAHGGRTELGHASSPLFQKIPLKPDAGAPVPMILRIFDRAAHLSTRAPAVKRRGCQRSWSAGSVINAGDETAPSAINDAGQVVGLAGTGRRVDRMSRNQAQHPAGQQEELGPADQRRRAGSGSFGANLTLHACNCGQTAGIALSRRSRLPYERARRPEAVPLKMCQGRAFVSCDQICVIAGSAVKLLRLAVRIPPGAPLSTSCNH